MADVSTVYLFGDQTDDSRAYLRALLRANQDPVLKAFLHDSYLRVRTEVLRLNRNEKATTRFSSLLELLEVEFQGPSKVAVEHAITSICQFGVFFWHCHEAGGQYPTRNSYLVGLCTGSLTAAAVGCCRSVSELLPVAVELTVMSFCIGEFAARTGACVSYDSVVGNGSWAVAIPDMHHDVAEEKISALIKSKNIIKSSWPYVSVKSPRSVTICGPPQVLAQVITSDEFKTSTLVSLPIFAPYHAEHLYKEHDLDSLLGEVGTANLSQTLPIIFSQESGVTHGSDLKKALSVAVRAIFMQCIDIEQLATALGDQLRDKQTSHRLVPIVSGAGPLMQKSLGSESGVHITITKSSLQPLSNNTHDTLSFQSSIRSKIAIVGSSGRFPTADDNGAFWDLLIQGKDVHKPAPASRWDVNTHVDQSEKPRKNTSATSFGCWLENPGLFDAKFFGMSPREAEQVDPAQRLALMAAYEALEDGGIVSGARSSQPSRVGVAFGVTSNDWMETNSAQDIDTYMIPGGNRAFIPGRINYAFKFSGPSYAIDTACSSSLAAIEVACRVLWMQEADTMIAGGTNIITNPDFTAGLDRGRFLSRTGNCKTFDDSADGYCRAEGVGVVILKRLEDALQDGDLVQAVIVNIGTNHSAEANSITRPYPQAQSNLFSRVLNGLSPAKISYVEMHGTGTQVGDAAEMSSVLDAIAPDQGPHRRLEGDICYIGSVKANLGHGEAVAGVTSLVKLLLMMKHSTIPPHVGIKSRLNRKFPKDLAARGIHIAASATPWKRHGSQTRYALLNNFSAAGGNTTLLLEDAPIDNARTTVEDPRPVFPIVISAKSSAALQANTRSILRFLQEQSDTDISSLSYTLSARRLHHFHRLALSGSSASDIVSKLSVALQGAKMRTGTPQQSIMFVFTGQGGHYIGMGRDLYHTNAIFRADVDRYDGLAKMLGFGSFLPLIRDDGGDLAAFGPVETQLAHISLQMALCRLWTSWGVAPSSVMGHSLGHYAALYAAGILSEADSIFAVGIRAQILQSKCQPGTHLMLAVKAGKNVIERLLQGTDLEIACVNGPQDIVISGQRASIEHLEDALSEQNIRSKTLDIQYAFHSSQVECMLEDFGSAIQGITFGIPRIPVLCPRRGTVIHQGESLDRSHLMDHLRGTVDIVSAIEAAEKEGVINNRSHFVEIGYHPAVTTMLKAILGTDCSANGSLKRNLNNWISLTQMTTSLYEAGTNIRWEEFHRDFVANFRIVQVPHYKWDLKNYWIQYVNDWSLYKGNSPRTISSSDRPSPLSRTIHEVVSEDIKDVPGTIVLRSDLSRSELHTIVQGHKVNGLPLCTPSIYADIALTVARYLVKIFPNAFTGKQICIKSMNISKALIAQPKGPQWLRTLVQIEKNHVVTCQFSSVNDDGVVIIHHADCEIGYDSHNSLESMQDQALQTTTAIKNIRADLASGTAYRFNTSMIYRMVATLADFDPAYRGLNEIVLNSHTMAAASKVDFSVLPEDGNHLDFSASPAYIDAFSQLAGFVMNANEASDLGKECFVNHGWGSLTLYENLDRNATYECHVKMEKREGTIWKGTLTVIQEESLIAIFEDLTLQGVPPRFLHHVLSSTNKVQAQKESVSHIVNQDVILNSELPHLAGQAMTDERLVDLTSGLDQILDIVSEESGIDKAELNDDIELVDLGIDSLLSLLIAGRLKDDVGFDAGSGISLFDEYGTLRQLKDAYAKSRGMSISGSSSSSSASKTASGIETPSSGSDSLAAIEFSPDQYVRRAKSVAGTSFESARPVTSLVLQQASSQNSTTLFLFPDGSGSAASYISLPPLSPQITVVGLISPYRRDPENMNCSLEALMTSYVTEIKRRQPSDGYTLGGWSSGGIFAFITAQMLLNNGDTVNNLLLLDSPPLKLDSGLGQLPPRFYEHCHKVGVFDQITPSNDGKGYALDQGRLIPHFKATVDLLAGYSAEPLHVPREVSKPRVSLCWAGKCALDGVRYESFTVNATDLEGVRFLTETRTDFGPGAWADLFPGIHCHVATLRDWDHFNMMVGDGAKDLGGFIANCL